MKTDKLSKWLPGRLASVFAAAGKTRPADLVGMNFDALYRLKGFAHASFHDLSKHLWDMGFHFDYDGTIRRNDGDDKKPAPGGHSDEDYGTPLRHPCGGSE